MSTRKIKLKHIMSGIAGPTGNAARDKLLAILSVHRVLLWPWGLLSGIAGGLLFISLGYPFPPVYKAALGIAAVCLLQSVIYEIDMIYDAKREDKYRPPFKTTLPLVTGLLSVKTVAFFALVELIFGLWVAYLFNLVCFSVALIGVVLGVIYVAGPLKKLNEFQRHIAHSFDGILLLGGIAAIAPDKVLSIEALIATAVNVFGCISHHCPDAPYFTTISKRDFAKFTAYTSLIHLVLVGLLWYVFDLNWALFLALLVFASVKFRAILDAYRMPDVHELHIKCFYTGIKYSELVLLTIVLASLLNIFF